MSYLATRPDSQVYFQPAIDYFSGNGATSQFTLSRPVASVAQIIVSVANVIQNPNTFSVNNNILTLGGNAPTGTNNIWVQYQTAVTQVNQPGQGTVGTSQLMVGAVGQNNLAAGVAGNGPAFRSVVSTAQALSPLVHTKATVYASEQYDTNNNYDNTSCRFTPTVSGYYLINAGIEFDATNTVTYISVYKNGSVYQRKFSGYTSTYSCINIDAQVYMNGTTDYIEIYLAAGTAANTYNTGVEGYFSGSLVRAA